MGVIKSQITAAQSNTSTIPVGAYWENGVSQEDVTTLAAGATAIVAATLPLPTGTNRMFNLIAHYVSTVAVTGVATANIMATQVVRNNAGTLVVNFIELGFAESGLGPEVNDVSVSGDNLEFLWDNSDPYNQARLSLFTIYHETAVPFATV